MLSLNEFASVFVLILFGMLIFYPIQIMREFVFDNFGNGAPMILIQAAIIELVKVSALMIFLRNIEKPDFSDIIIGSVGIFTGLLFISLFNNFATTGSALSSNLMSYLFFLIKHAGSLFIFSLTLQLDKKLFWMATILAVTVNLGFEMVQRIITISAVN